MIQSAKGENNMKTALLVINPSSGGEKAQSYKEQVINKLTSSFDDVVVKQTQKAGDATQFTREAAQAGIHSVFVMGGDGTVNEGICGIAEQEVRPYFGFFPLGTVNDLARALDIPLDPQEAIDAFDVNRYRPLDIGKVNDTYFMNVIAIGTIPQAINDVDPEEKTKFGKLAYFMNGFKHLMEHQSYSFHLTLDGEQKEITSSTLLIGLTNSIGGFEHLLPNASVDDGLLHLIYTKDENMLDTLKALPNLVTGVTEGSQSLGYTTFKEGSIKLLDGQLQINIDGDEGDALPIDIQVLPSHISIYY